MPYPIGALVSTTVYSRGDRQAEVTGRCVDVKMSRRYPERVASYIVDATGSGYGTLVVDANKARIG